MIHQANEDLAFDLVIGTDRLPFVGTKGATLLFPFGEQRHLFGCGDPPSLLLTSLGTSNDRDEASLKELINRKLGETIGTEMLHVIEQVEVISPQETQKHLEEKKKKELVGLITDGIGGAKGAGTKAALKIVELIDAVRTQANDR